MFEPAHFFVHGAYAPTSSFILKEFQKRIVGGEMKTRNYLSVILVLSVLMLTIGCGGTDFGPIGAIKGKLTFRSKKVPEGTKVIFMNSEVGHTGFGLTDAEGNYSIEWRREGKTYDGLPVGTYGVMIVAAEFVDVDEMSADEMLEGGPGNTPKRISIPPKYMRVSTSGLEFTINNGENEIDIDVK